MLKWKKARGRRFWGWRRWKRIGEGGKIFPIFKYFSNKKVVWGILGGVVLKTVLEGGVFIIIPPT